MVVVDGFFLQSGHIWVASGADAIKKYTPSLGIPYLGI
jgi:hypothetical protein